MGKSIVIDALIRFSACAIAVAGLGTSPVVADWKSDRPAKIMVPFTAGGASDTMLRTVAAEVAQDIGQPIIIENKPGASGKVMYESLKAIRGDGYTLGYISTTVAVLTAVSSRLNFDPVQDFKPITVLAQFESVLAANPKLPANSFAEFVNYAKANPGKLNFASYGAKGQGHLNLEQIMQITGTNIVHVPYKGEAPALAALLANEVDVSPLVLSPKQYVEAGKLKILAAFGTSRHPDFPDIKTIREQGIDFASSAFMGIGAAPGTSDEAVDFWNRSFVKALQKPALIQRLRELGFTARGTSKEELAKVLASEIGMYRNIVTVAKIELD